MHPKPHQRLKVAPKSVQMRAKTHPKTLQNVTNLQSVTNTRKCGAKSAQKVLKTASKSAQKRANVTPCAHCDKLSTPKHSRTLANTGIERFINR